MITDALHISRQLFLPLLLLVIPAQYLLGLFPGTPWEVVPVLWAAQWSILSAYAGILIEVSRNGVIKREQWRARLRGWLVVALVYIAIAALGSLVPGVLRTYGGPAGVPLFIVVGWLGVLASLLLLPAPAVAALSGHSPGQALREALAIMARRWTRAVLMVGLIALPTALGLLAYHFLPWANTPWASAKSLVTVVLSSMLYLPALSLAALFAQPDSGTIRQKSQVNNLPIAILLATALSIPGVLAAATNLVLQLIMPISAQNWGIPSGNLVMFVAMFLPVTPVGLLIFALPGIWSGWAAQRLSGRLWIAVVPGLIYGLLIIHIQFGYEPFKQTGLAILYGVGLASHMGISLLGAVLSRRRQSSGKGYRHVSGR